MNNNYHKVKVNMTNWRLRSWSGGYNLSGIADNHPSLGKNAYIRFTSPLIQYELDEENDVLIYETLNTIYVCPLKYMYYCKDGVLEPECESDFTEWANNNSNNVLDMIACINTLLLRQLYDDNEAEYLGNLKKEVVDMYMHIKSLVTKGKEEIAAMIQNENERLIDIARQYEDCIYIEMSNIGEGSKLAYHLGESVGIVEPYVHVGMFQDSVLYTEYAVENNSCELDFRYFPKEWGTGMESYCWSDNIKQVVIKNDGSCIIKFNNEAIEVGETKVFTPDKHTQGIVNPDW